MIALIKFAFSEVAIGLLSLLPLRFWMGAIEVANKAINRKVRGNTEDTITYLEKMYEKSK